MKKNTHHLAVHYPFCGNLKNWVTISFIAHVSENMLCYDWSKMNEWVHSTWCHHIQHQRLLSSDAVSLNSASYLEQDLDCSVDHAHPSAQEGEEWEDELDEVVWQRLEAMEPPRGAMHVVGHGVRNWLGLGEDGGVKMWNPDYLWWCQRHSFLAANMSVKGILSRWSWSLINGLLFQWISAQKSSCIFYT